MSASMTRQHYQLVATMLGDMGRSMGDNTWEDVLTVAVRHLRGTNPRFDEGKVRAWASDVRAHRRDLDGRRRDDRVPA